MRLFLNLVAFHLTRQVCQTTLYHEAVQELGLTITSPALTPVQLIDGRVWDGEDAVRYATAFDINARK